MKIVVDPGCKAPTRAHEYDAGLDLYAAEPVYIAPHDFAVVETGVHVEIPKGFVGLLTSKSGLMAKGGLTCRGTIDCGYTGSIKAIIFNHSFKTHKFEPGDKVTQLVVLPCITPELEVVETLEETERGAGGFGSTGK